MLHEALKESLGEKAGPKGVRVSRKKIQVSQPLRAQKHSIQTHAKSPLSFCSAPRAKSTQETKAVESQVGIKVLRSSVERC